MPCRRAAPTCRARKPDDAGESRMRVTSNADVETGKCRAIAKKLGKTATISIERMPLVTQ